MTLENCMVSKASRFFFGLNQGFVLLWVSDLNCWSFVRVIITCLYILNVIQFLVLI